MAKPELIALVGIDHRDHRYEPGDGVDDLPEKAKRWLLRDGLIARAEESDA